MRWEHPEAGTSSSDELQNLIRKPRPVQIRIIVFVTLALVLLNSGHAYDSIRLAVSNAKRMEVTNFYLDIQAIQDNLERDFVETLTDNSGDRERAFQAMLEGLDDERHFLQLHTSSPSILRVNFGDQQWTKSVNLSNEQDMAVMDFLDKGEIQNKLLTNDFESFLDQLDQLDQFVFNELSSEQFLIAQAPLVDGAGEIVLVRPSITREVAFWNAVRTSIAFAMVVFWLGVWFAIIVSTFVGRRINLSNAAIQEALKARDRINTGLESIVSDRTKELEAAKAAAESASRSKGAFLANMSHEIRTPMNGVLGMAELMDRTTLTEDQRRQLQTITNSSEALLRILDDILDISKIEAGQLQIEQTVTKIRDLAESISMAMASEADKRNVRLSLIVLPAVPEELHSDPVRLRQIFYNLLSNAIKFSESAALDKQGEVLFRIDYLDGDVLKIEVADNGIGISSQHARNLFQPFSQAEVSTTRRFGGSGLGLSITKNLVELLGGRIELETEVGIGSTFTVSLPSKKLKEHRLEWNSARVPHYFLFDHETKAQSANTTVTLEVPAPICEFRNEDELRAAVLNTEQRVVVVLALQSMSDNLGARQRLMTTTGCEDFVLLTSERSARFGLHTLGYYVASMFPILPSELERATSALLRPKDELFSEKDTSALGRTEADGSGFSGQKVLLVEDNEINVVVLSKQLEILGLVPEIARDGVEGLQKWKSGDFELVLTDCHMPQMDGFELTREIREAEIAEARTPSRIIAITANAMKGEAERCIAAGMDGYLSKPAKLDQLREALCATNYS